MTVTLTCGTASSSNPKESFFPAEAVACGDAEIGVELSDWGRSGDHAASVSLFGWCVSRTGAPAAVEFQIQGIAIASAPLRVPRPDVVAALGRPDTPLLCGFHLRLSKLVLPLGAVVDVVLSEVRGNGWTVQVPLGALAGLPPARIAPGYRERHHPLLLLGMGRSGTTYAMRLLSGHPDVLVPGRHPYELRPPVWLWHAAQVLSAPGDDASMHPDGFESRDANRVGSNPYRSRDWEDGAGRDAVVRWQEEGVPAAAVDFCKQQVDEFVRAAAGRLGPPRYVAQKMLLSLTRHFVRNIYPGAREVFLVRDFRDVWLSARSFNRKRGTASFGRECFPDDLAWLRGLAASTRQVRLAHRAAGPGAVTLRYEDLMRDAPAAVAGMLAGLGLDDAPDLVRQLIAEAGNGDGAEDGAHQTSAPGATLDRWRREMTVQEKVTAAEALGEDLRYFGYHA